MDGRTDVASNVVGITDVDDGDGGGCGRGKEEGGEGAGVHAVEGGEGLHDTWFWGLWTWERLYQCQWV